MDATILSKVYKYATAAAAFLSIQGKSNSQVVYTDIDPDLLLDEAGETGGLDIDNNGTIDFAFLNSSFSYYNNTFFSFRTRQDILAGPYISQNALAGDSKYYYEPYGGFTWYFPFALENNTLIDENLEWQTNGEQILGIRTFFNSGAGTFFCTNCYWYGFGIPETVDRYLGIRFIDSESQNHYGWIRCDVKDEGRTFVIKDYAYELQPDYPINAGDTIHYDSLNENIPNTSIYSFGNNIYIHCEQTGNNNEVLVFDTEGRLIFSDKITTNSFSVKLNQPSGIYIVQLLSGKEKYSNKIYFHP